MMNFWMEETLMKLTFSDAFGLDKGDVLFGDGNEASLGMAGGFKIDKQRLAERHVFNIQTIGANDMAWREFA